MATSSSPQRLTGAAGIVRTLEDLGVEVAFGIPGGMILPTYDPLYDSSIRHILVRHEQGAGHAAAGYAASSNKVGLCITTSGPGATNLVTALADANMDSVPMVAITGQVPSAAIGTDAFQESDIVGATMPLTKHSFLVTDVADIPDTIAAAFHIAGTGRPGPVLVDITKSAQQDQFGYSGPGKMPLPGYKPTTRPHIKQLRAAADLLRQAKRPVILAGGGIIRAEASAELTALTNAAKLPVVTTLMGLGVIPDAHPHNLGMGGMHGSVPAVVALQRADLILAVGTRFDDRLTGRLDTFAPEAKIIHADIDPAEIGKLVQADVPMVGEAKAVLRALAEQVARWDSPMDLTSWWAALDDLRRRYAKGYDLPSDGFLSPQKVIERLAALSPNDTIFTTGVGQHQMWSAQFLDHKGPKQFLKSGGLGTMGYGVPAAMGAKVANPDRTVWAIDGDGCFQMTGAELATCAVESIPIKVALMNNSSLGMVRQWQTLFYQERYSNTDLHTGQGTRMIPDFVKWAEAMGCAALRCDQDDQIDQAINQALAINDQPVLIDFQISRDAMVWPMVAAGASNDDIQYARGIAPEFDRQEV
ncbi:MAG: acetolactate synthase large subunit [Micrococcales bacterium]|nr:acetolactate synthase large subunit [Micrococcales bacterium]